MDKDPNAAVERSERAERPAPEKEITRREQTFWIIAAMAVMFGCWYGYEKRRDPTDPYAQCWPGYSTACKANIAAERMRSGYAE